MESFHLAICLIGATISFSISIMLLIIVDFITSVWWLIASQMLITKEE